MTDFNSQVEFDIPFLIENGNLYTSHKSLSGVYSPMVEADSDAGTIDIDDDAWGFFSTGFTGQHGYNGPIMHNSETLSGGLEKAVKGTDGVYVVCAVYWAPDPAPCCRAVVTSGDWGMHEPGCDGPGEQIVEGWVVLRLKD